MTSRVLVTSVFITLVVYLLVILQQQMALAAAETGSNSFSSAAQKPINNNRVLRRFIHPQNQYNKIRPELFNEFFGE